MEPWQYLLVLAAGIALFAAAAVSAARKREARKHRDFTRSLETLLQPRETVKVICPQKRGHCILTSQRIILEKKGEFTAFALKDIRRVQGKNREGNRTTVPAKMVSLTVVTDKEFTLGNTGTEFETLTKLLQEKVKKQKQKKAAAKAGKPGASKAVSEA